MLNEKGGALHIVRLLLYHVPCDTLYYLGDIMKCSVGEKKKRLFLTIKVDLNVRKQANNTILTF